MIQIQVAINFPFVVVPFYEVRKLFFQPANFLGSLTAIEKLNLYFEHYTNDSFMASYGFW